MTPPPSPLAAEESPSHVTRGTSGSLAALPAGKPHGGHQRKSHHGSSHSTRTMHVGANGTRKALTPEPTFDGPSVTTLGWELGGSEQGVTRPRAHSAGRQGAIPTLASSPEQIRQAGYKVVAKGGGPPVLAAAAVSPSSPGSPAGPHAAGQSKRRGSGNSPTAAGRTPSSFLRKGPTSPLDQGIVRKPRVDMAFMGTHDFPSPKASRAQLAPIPSHSTAVPAAPIDDVVIPVSILGKKGVDPLSIETHSVLHSNDSWARDGSVAEVGPGAPLGSPGVLRGREQLQPLPEPSVTPQSSTLAARHRQPFSSPVSPSLTSTVLLAASPVTALSLQRSPSKNETNGTSVAKSNSPGQVLTPTLR